MDSTATGEFVILSQNYSKVRNPRKVGKVAWVNDSHIVMY